MLYLGIDVGSTTVKAVLVNASTFEVVWSDYRRHHTRQPEVLRELLQDMQGGVPERVFITGSGAGPLVSCLGARFVQEVNAVTLAVERLHPDVSSVIELGGQDAKIILFRQNATTGDKTATTSMNDKCASGTGATIDKCMIKVGMAAELLSGLEFDAAKLHHVAAKCGVFAETDIVNLVKSGIPSGEIMNSLADAIVGQNLSVLTRGNTLKAKVLLLGGPNTYLPFLQACWRLRIPETWEARGYQPPDLPLEELIFVPENSLYYAALGAVAYGLHEPADVGIYRGLDGLSEYIEHGREARMGQSAGPPLVRQQDEAEQFREVYHIPPFQPATLRPGQVVRGVIGLDGGSTSSKAVLLHFDTREILCKQYVLSKGNPIQDTIELLSKIQAWAVDQGATLEVVGFGATGYAADVLEKTLRSDVNLVETVAHMLSAVHCFGPDIDVVCDVGGQDIKVLFLQDGEVRNFRLSNQCSAGNGMLLQAMADQFGVPVTEYAEVAFQAKLAPKFSYGCAVFLDSDRVTFQKEGFTREEMLCGLAQVLPKNIWQYVAQIPRLAALGKTFVLQGGTQYNLAALKAQVDYIKERVPGAEVFVHPHTGEAGALGVALETLRVVGRQGGTRWVGLENALNLKYESRNDESTRCHFCKNNCSRTFIDAETPDGGTARYIAGFSCEKGTVESEAAMLELSKARKQLMKDFPNLVSYEARQAFRKFYQPQEPPAEIEETLVKPGWFGSMKKTVTRRPFQKSGHKSGARVGIPKVLNVWSTAPFWRTYLEVGGCQVVFSDDTSEEMYKEGARYGSIDPCFPSKVAQAHLHNLLFHKGKLDYVLFPCITHLPAKLENLMDTTSCPIVAGAPEVMKAAFTKEVDFFQSHGARYLAPAVTFTEPAYMEKQLWECFGSILGITRDEHGHAVREGLRALVAFEADLEFKGQAILDQVEEENKVALVMLGRPYHSDPGLNHTILDEFQALGYPILSVRSLPKDKEWLARWFDDEDPLDITDVWPENYSANSAQKVWAAKLAARHPHLAVLDLSSFKCGHDAPTYGLIDGIIGASGTPYQALHDLDANKPGGSLKIRVKTFAHTLKLYQEELDDVAGKKLELKRRLEEKRLELLLQKDQKNPEIEILRQRLARYQPAAQPEPRVLLRVIQ